MGASGQPEYLAMLAKVLASPEPELRAAAADSIGMIGPTDDETPQLSKLLNDKSPEVVRAAKRALAAPRAQ
jgi:HEAT repeat protein